MMKKQLAKSLKKKIPSILIVATSICFITYLGLSFGPASVEGVTIVDPSDGWVVEGDLYVPRGHSPPYPAVILSHGDNMDHLAMSSIAAAIAQKGIIVLNIDLSGYGRSPNDWGLDNFQQDYKTGFNYLSHIRTDVDKSRIGAAGFSRGAQVSLFCVHNLSIRHIACLGYTWDQENFNASYPANIIFITGINDKMMYPYLVPMMQTLTGRSNVQEGIIYGNFANYTARQYKNFNCDHVGTITNIGVIDATAAWFDRCLNDIENSQPSFTIIKSFTQFASIIGIAMVSVWLAYFLGGHSMLPQAKTTDSINGTKKQEKNQTQHSENILKSGIFIGLYVVCWLPTFLIYLEPSKMTQLTFEVGKLFPFLTGNQASSILVIILLSFPQLLSVGLLVRFLFGRIERKLQVPETSGDEKSTDLIMPLRLPIKNLCIHLISGAIVIGVLMAGLILALQFTYYKIVPFTADQWNTFFLMLPFIFIFSLADQVWFGAVIQRRSIYQSNSKMFLSLLASLLLKAIIIGLFMITCNFYIIPLSILLFMTLLFNWWLTHFFKSIYPGALVTSVFISLLVPIFYIIL